MRATECTSSWLTSEISVDCTYCINPAETHDPLSNMLGRVLETHRHFIDPMELSLVLHQSGLGLVAAVMGFTAPPLPSINDQYRLIRFTDNPLPALWMIDRLPENQRIDALIAEIEGPDPLNPDQAVGVMPNQEPDYTRHRINRSLENRISYASDHLTEILSMAPTASASPPSQPASYLSELPFGSHYLGALVPHESERLTLKGIALIASAAKILIDLHKVSPNRDVDIEASWHALGSSYSYIVFYSHPVFDQKDFDTHLRETLKKLLFEWLVKSPLKTASIEIMTSSFQQFSTGQLTTFTEAADFFSDIIQIIEASPIQLLANDLEAQHPVACDVEDSNFKRYNSRLRSLDIDTPAPEELHPMTDITKALMTEQLTLTGAVSTELATVFPASHIEPQPSGEAVFFHKPHENNMTIEAVQPGQDLVKLSELLPDFQAWPVSSRIHYINNLTELVQNINVQYLNLSLNNMLSYADVTDHPVITLRNASELEQVDQRNALARLILEILSGQPLNDDRPLMLSQAISLITPDCLEAVPEYARIFIELMHQAYWLPDASFEPALNMDELLAELRQVNRHVHDYESQPILTLALALQEMSPFIPASPTPQLVQTLSPATYALSKLLTNDDPNYQRCFNSAVHERGRCHPGHLARHGILSVNSKLRCADDKCSADLTPFYGWADLGTAHWLNARTGCCYLSEESVKATHIIDLLIACSPADAGEAQRQWLDQHITAPELEWLFEHLPDSELWEHAAFLSGASVETLIEAQNETAEDKRKRLFKHLPKRLSMIASLQEAGIEDAKKFLPNRSSEDIPAVLESHQQLLLRLLTIKKLESSQKLNSPLNADALRKKHKFSANMPDWLVFQKALKNNNKLFFPWLLETPLNACRQLQLKLDGKLKEADRFISCIVELADQHQLSHHWPLLGHLFGLNRTTLAVIATLKSDKERLKKVLSHFVENNAGIPDPETLGLLLGNAGMPLIARLLHLPWRFNGAPGPAALLLHSMRQQIEQALHQQATIFGPMMLRDLHDSVPAAHETASCANEPALMIHFQNLKLSKSFSLNSGNLETYIDNSWQPGFFSHLPTNSEIQAWWLMPRRPFQSNELAALIGMIEKATAQLQVSLPHLKPGQIRLTTGHLQEDSHYLQIILYTTPIDSIPPDTSLYFELTHALLQSFAGRHFPLAMMDLYYSDQETVARQIEHSGQMPLGRTGLIKSLASQLFHWLHESRHTPPNDAFLNALKVKKSPPVKPRSAATTAAKWSQRGLLPGKTIQLGDIEPDIPILTLQQQHLSAVLRTLMVMGYLNSPPEYPVALNNYLPETMTGGPSSQTGRWLTSVAHFIPEDHIVPVIMYRMGRNGEWIESGCEGETSAILPLQSGGRRLHICSPHEKILPVRGHSNWALNERASYLLELRKLLEAIHRDGYYTGPIALDQLVLVMTEGGDRLPGLLINRPLQEGSSHSFRLSLQLALEILNTEPVPRIKDYPGDTVLAQILSTAPLAPQLASAILQFIKPFEIGSIEELGSYTPDAAQITTTAVAPRRQIPAPERFIGHPHPVVRVPSTALVRYQGTSSNALCENCSRAITAQERFHCLFCPGNSGSKTVDICHNCRGLPPVSSESDFGHYQQRLDSFLGCWPPMDSRALAAAGFYVRPCPGNDVQQNGAEKDAPANEVVCHDCNINIQPHLGIEDIWETHCRQSPACSHVQAFWPVRSLAEIIRQLVTAINDSVEPTTGALTPVVHARIVDELFRQSRVLGLQIEALFKAGVLSEEALINNFCEAIEANAKECMVCLDTPSNARIQPCNHRGCYDCLSKLARENKLCPKCRGDIKGVAPDKPKK